MKALTKFVTLAVLILAFHSSALRAEIGTIVHKANPKKNALPAHLMQQRTDFEEVDSFYRDFFGKLDPEIEQSYKNRFWYHETQVNYGLPWWRREVIGFASVEGFGRGPFEGDVRKDMATQVFRMRVDAGVRAALYKIKNPSIVKATKTFQNTMSQINNYPLRLSSKPGSKAGEFRIGYDVLSDNSKIEYVQGIVEGGLYHPQLFGFVTRQKSWDIANLSLSTNIGNAYPKATLSLPLHQNTIGGTVSKSLSETVSASVRTDQPLKDQNQPHSYYAEVAYRF